VSLSSPFQYSQTPPPLSVCFIWHMHQPSYKDSLTGQYLMPWVRLHAAKDYLDMVALLDEFPDIRQTFNLVPSLLDQLQDYSKPGWLDKHEVLCAKAEPFTKEDKRFILERFFDANPHRMIRRIPAYFQHFETKQRFPNPDEALSHFSEQDFCDITAQFHLVWIDPLWAERRPEVKALIEKEKGYTLLDRIQILEIIRDLVKAVIPTYKSMQESGQIEITTTPYYHPILPLLIDTDSAKVGKPAIHLPNIRFQHPEDARVHLEKAIDQYQSLFGVAPRGLWPSEQSVSPDVMKLFNEYGVQWAVSSEGNLARSLDIFWDKDEYGHVRNVHELVSAHQNHGVNLLFRHLTLSDLIGFNYSTFPAEEAAMDCVNRLKRIQSQMVSNHPEIYYPVVTIALDGENCWESYQEDGTPFLRALYQALSQDSSLSVCRVEDYFKTCPPHQVKALPYLHSGSWIESDFHIWIGDPVKNTAWVLLYQTRSQLQAFEDALTVEEKQAQSERLKQAWEEIYVAEGSDWFWWFGEPHNSGQDDLFDLQFRLHLQNVYELLGLPVPAVLMRPLSPKSSKVTKEPHALIQPKLDGLLTHPDEWLGAGQFDLSTGEGAMHRGDRLVTRIYYGFDATYLYLRCNIQKDSLKPNQQITFYACTHGKIRHNSPIRLKIQPNNLVTTQSYLYAYEFQVKLFQENQQSEANVCLRVAEAAPDHLWISRPDIEGTVAFQDILEMAIPFESLGVGPGEAIAFALAVSEDEVVVEFAPPYFLLPLHRPNLPPEHQEETSSKEFVVS
jgi:alpha-amylase/alpha-mannosidase (GH57 family)